MCANFPNTMSEPNNILIESYFQLKTKYIIDITT